MFMRSRMSRWMMWMALAAAAMYFFDPDRGEARRKDLRARIEGYRQVAEKEKAKLQTSV
jgi:hypothetical protein